MAPFSDARFFSASAAAAASPSYSSSGRKQFLDEVNTSTSCML